MSWSRVRPSGAGARPDDDDEEVGSAGQAWRALRCRRAQHFRARGTVCPRYEECSSAIGGDDAKAAERVRNEPDKLACNTSGLHALRRDGDVEFWVGKGVELGGDDGAERRCALGVERLVGQRGFVVLCRGFFVY
jgi:hypothetical protein